MLLSVSFGLMISLLPASPPAGITVCFDGGKCQRYGVGNYRSLVNRVGRRAPAARQVIDRGIGGPDLRPLAAFRGLTELRLNHTSLASARGLERLTALRQVVIRKGRFSTLPTLARLTRLQSLDLDAPLTSLASLRGLKGLRRLWISSKTLKNIAPLAGLTGLRDVMITDAPVTDLSPLGRCGDLRRLNLSRTKVRDLKALAGLRHLSTLDLGSTPVTDLRPLHSLKGLKELGLSYVKVTAAQIAALKAALPGLRVYR